jgi:hypothetical protein
MKLVNLVIVSTPDSQVRLMIGDTEDGKFSYGYVYDRRTFAPVDNLIRKLRRMRRFVVFGPYVWRKCPAVRLMSPEGAAVRNFLTPIIPDMSRAMDAALKEKYKDTLALLQHLDSQV